MPVTDAPSQRTLEQVPARVFKFLMGVSVSFGARAALGAKGYDRDEHAYAWTRLQKLGQFSSTGLKLDSDVRVAVIELDAWDEPNFTAMQNALLRDHPEQAEFLFDGLESKQGKEAVLGVEILLDRLDLMQKGKDRPEQSREADVSALELLARRGYTVEERKRLRSLVELTGAVAPAPVPELTQKDCDDILVELYRWLADWSSQAHSVISSRATLIRLGLAKRRTKASAGDEPDEDETPPASKGPKTST